MFRKKSKSASSQPSSERTSFESSPPTPKKPVPPTSSSPFSSKKNKTSKLTSVSELGVVDTARQAKLYLDDFGRIDSKPQAAFSGNKKEDFGHGFGIGQDEEVEESQLIYGYTACSTNLEFGAEVVVGIVAKCCRELRERGEIITNKHLV